MMHGQKNIKSHILGPNFIFLEKRPFYEIMQKNNLEPERSQMTIWRMRIAH